MCRLGVDSLNTFPVRFYVLFVLAKVQIGETCDSNPVLSHLFRVAGFDSDSVLLKLDFDVQS